jgi:hypothetical protein
MSSKKLGVMDAILGAEENYYYYYYYYSAFVPGNGGTCERPCPFIHVLCRQHSGVFPGGGMMVWSSKEKYKYQGYYPGRGMMVRPSIKVNMVTTQASDLT